MTICALALARFVHFAATALLFGLAAFPLYVLRPPERFAPARAVRLMRALRVCTLVVAVGVLAVFLATAANMAGDPAAAFDPATLAGVLQDTGFGRIWAARLGLALVLAIWAFRRRMIPGRLFAGLAGLLLASVALTGHSRMQDGPAGILHIGADALHLLAAGWWIGGLAALLLTVVRSGADQGADEPSAAAALSRFSGVGYGAVAILVVSGLIDSWLLVGGLGNWLTTTYGRLLMVKIGLFAAMGALALSNRLRISPALALGSDADLWLARLRRRVLAEQVLGALVVAAVALLGLLEPPVSG
jgi:putative copper resistance protein D